MKTQKFTLEIDEDDEITLGLVRLVKEVPDYELFYHLNILNPFKFTRIADLIYRGKHYDYYFPRFQSFHLDTQICIHFIANQSSQSIQKSLPVELFNTEGDTKYLLDHFPDVNYLITTSEPFDDFSLILLPENLLFQIQHFQLSPNEELYQLIQYYE
ncbi:IPExxxVDY family protein [Kaistella flava (ex Peng et al. 2021)]|uniref:IPExxxVDY family protein n=1 Tax=Kaistella flava (ex Peng et al. 2021) TaxID=2038776 RepID=A0A7M2YCN0_9FLAO|nr:IPExxxVDY family protein [Kaistella flava (ex Peng et al. 2021)]QOW11405.1 IPExxxVDY family protein [Kaistella flava (ex Peng et al. 2021)]